MRGVCEVPLKQVHVRYVRPWKQTQFGMKVETCSEVAPSSLTGDQLLRGLLAARQQVVALKGLLLGVSRAVLSGLHYTRESYR